MTETANKAAIAKQPLNIFSFFIGALPFREEVQKKAKTADNSVKRTQRLKQRLFPISLV
jgi:hypothetical protein